MQGTPFFRDNGDRPLVPQADQVEGTISMCHFY